MSTTSKLNQLPEELLIEIITFLKTSSYPSIFQISKEFNSLSQITKSSSSFWKILLIRDLDLSHIEIKEIDELMKDMKDKKSGEKGLKNYKELYKQCYENHGYYILISLKYLNKKFELDRVEYDGEFWCNCCATNGKIVVFSFERYSCTFKAFSCKTGKLIHDQKRTGDSSGIFIYKDMIYVGLGSSVNVYDANTFQFIRNFGKNSAKLPRTGGIISRSESEMIEKLRNGHGGSVTHIFFNEKLNIIVTGASDGYVYHWNMKNYNFKGKITNGGYVEQMVGSGNVLAVGQGSKVKVINLKTKVTVFSVRMDSCRLCIVKDILFIGEGKQITLYKFNMKKKDLNVKQLVKIDHGEYLQRRIYSDSSSSSYCAKNRGSIILLPHGKDFEIHEVNKDFEKGKFEKSRLIKVDLETTKFTKTKWAAIGNATFSKKYIFASCGRFNMARWKLVNK